MRAVFVSFKFREEEKVSSVARVCSKPHLTHKKKNRSLSLSPIFSFSGDADRPPDRGDGPGGHRPLDHLPPEQPERPGGAGEAEGSGGEDGEAGKSFFFFFFCTRRE